MSLIDTIRIKVGSGEFEYSQHAVDQTTLRRIAGQELREAIANGEVIEDYLPTTKNKTEEMAYSIPQARAAKMAG